MTLSVMKKTHVMSVFSLRGQEPLTKTTFGNDSSTPYRARGRQLDVPPAAVPGVGTCLPCSTRLSPELGSCKPKLRLENAVRHPHNESSFSKVLSNHRMCTSGESQERIWTHGESHQRSTEKQHHQGDQSLSPTDKIYQTDNFVLAKTTCAFNMLDIG